MGIVADTSVFIAYERRGTRASALEAALSTNVSSYPIVLSAISVAELAHGIYRAKTSAQASVRRAFVEEVIASFKTIDFTQHTAWIAAQIRGEQSKLGNTLPLADSFIAAAAIELNYIVLTSNVKDFTRIPNLSVIHFDG